ncbi:MAG: 2-oxoglutarate dehydrogenase, E2 component, dihydrolipoamide succinyltransferase [bacterium]|nr:2-oxoglutarate dehydrogenase, E2 component, dihydrolipoamide succinyltransferase [bacterium]
MATEVIMPQMGESIAEGTITRWLVKVGDRVERDQPLFEISTDKVDAEIPSPADGVLLEIKFDEGATVPVNDIVARLGEPGELGEMPAAADLGAKEAALRVPLPGTPEERPQESAASLSASAESGAAPAGGDAERVRAFSSPLVRKMAAEAQVDLSRVEGTGIHGRVTKRDLEGYLENAGLPAEAEEEPFAASAVPSPPASAPPAQIVTPMRRDPGTFSVAPYSEGDNVEIAPMSRIRQITAAHMSYSKATSAHVTTVFQMDLARVARTRDRAKAGFAAAHGTKLTYMPFIFTAVASALKSNPKLNASIDGTNIVFKKDINLGMAVALDWGLIVPVIRNADQLNLVGLAKAANDLAARARTKKLQPHEVQNGTFTVTNPGVFGSLFGMPIINQPQVAILGLGVIEKRPVVDTDREGNDIIAIKPMSYFAITYDHRLVDGADADHFMNDVKRTLAEETWSELDPFI